MNFNSIRKPRRMAVLASGVVAAVSLVAGAGQASAGIGDLSVPNNPTTAVCDYNNTCKVQDKDGIVRVTRYKDAWHTSSSLTESGPKQVTVVNDDSYAYFQVTDKLGFTKTFLFPGQI